MRVPDGRSSEITGKGTFGNDPDRARLIEHNDHRLLKSWRSVFDIWILLHHIANRLRTPCPASCLPLLTERARNVNRQIDRRDRENLSATTSIRDIDDAMVFGLIVSY
jgi:hypothetical protein